MKHVFIKQYEITNDLARKSIPVMLAGLLEGDCHIYCLHDSIKNVQYAFGVEWQGSLLASLTLAIKEREEHYAEIHAKGFHAVWMHLTNADEFWHIGGICGYCDEFVFTNNDTLYAMPFDPKRPAHLGCLQKSGYFPVPEHAHELN